MKPAQPQNSTGRLHELDALRGIAACVVVLHHLRYFLVEEHPRWWLRPFFDGRSAVVLFFTLSGFVLSLAFWDGKQLPYGRYIVRRFFRIYVPYACAVLIAAAVGRWLDYAQLPLTHWFYLTWHAPIDLHLVESSLLKMRTTPELNTAFWSLRYEVEMSIVFPALCWLMARLGLAGSLLLGVLAAGGGYWMVAADFFREPGFTLMWGSCFVFGAVLAWKRDALAVAYKRAPRLGLAALLLVALCGMYSYDELLIIPSTCVLIVFAQRGWLKRTLRQPLPEYLGRLSYSLYLLHGTVLFASFILLYGRVPVWLVMLIGVAASFGLAQIFHVGLEMPADGLGKRLTRRRKLAAPAVRIEA